MWAKLVIVSWVTLDKPASECDEIEFTDTAQEEGET